MRIDTSLPGSLLGPLRRKYRSNFFVETGTCHGDTAELAAVMFDRVFTCELDPSLIAEATERLAPYKNVLIAQMESPAFLRKIKFQVCQPAIYWLDAHWCGGPVKAEKECPVLEELEAIGSLNGHSVVLLDDAQLMLSPPKGIHDPAQWPTWEQIQAAFAAWPDRVDLRVVDGPHSKIIVATPKDVADWLASIQDDPDGKIDQPTVTPDT